MCKGSQSRTPFPTPSFPESCNKKGKGSRVVEPTTTTTTTTPAPTISNERLAKLLALRARLLEKGVANPFDNLSEYFKWQNEIDDHLKTGQSGWATGWTDGQTDRLTEL